MSDGSGVSWSLSYAEAKKHDVVDTSRRPSPFSCSLSASYSTLLTLNRFRTAERSSWNRSHSPVKPDYRRICHEAAVPPLQPTIYDQPSKTLSDAHAYTRPHKTGYFELRGNPVRLHTYVSVPKHGAPRSDGNIREGCRPINRDWSGPQLGSGLSLPGPVIISSYIGPRGER